MLAHDSHWILQAEIEVSDEEEIADPEVDNTVRGKGGRKTGGRHTGTADAVASAAKLQQASCPSNMLLLVPLLLLAVFVKWHVVLCIAVWTGTDSIQGI